MTEQMQTSAQAPVIVLRDVKKEYIVGESHIHALAGVSLSVEPGEFVWTGGDCHIYDNHVDQVLEQLSREPYPYPTMKLHKADSLFEYDYGDFEIVDYRYHPTIKAPIAV